MNWYGFVLVAAAVFIVSSLLKVLPQTYAGVSASIAALIGFVLIPILLKRGRQSANQKAAASAPPAQVVLAQRDSHFILYLRPFISDAQAPNNGIIRRHLLDAYGMPEDSSELSLVSALNAIAPVVAIGQPASDAHTQIGALRYYVPEGADWQDNVLQLINRARAVIVRLDEVSPGVTWELEQLATHRQFHATAFVLSNAATPDDVYLRLLSLLSANLSEQLPQQREDIVALYIDTTGTCHPIRKMFAALLSIDQFAVQQMTLLVKADLAASDEQGSDAATQAFVGVRCWHRKGMGLTPRNSYVGKLVLSPQGFKFLSSGASLTREILQQANPVASANATLHLDDQALTNSGSLFIQHSSLQAMAVHSLHIRIEYLNEKGEIQHCAFALDGMANNTEENLNGMVQAYIYARKSAEAAYEV